MATKIILYTARKNSKNQSPVTIQYIYNRKPSRFTTGISVTAEQFDKDKQRIRKHEDADTLNAELSALKARIDATALALTKQGKEATYNAVQAAMGKGEMKAALNHAIADIFKTGVKSTGVKITFDREEEEPETEEVKQVAQKTSTLKAESDFNDAYAAYMQFSRATKAKSTVSKYDGVFNTVRAFLASVNKPVTFASFAEKNFGYMFQNYLLTEHINYRTKQKGIVANAAFGICKQVATMLDWCIANEYCEKFSTKKIRMKKVETDLQYLTADELKPLVKLMKAETLPKNLQESLELMLVMAYSGLRDSDLRRLKPVFIKNGCIDFRTKKTNTDACTPITGVVQWVLDKYKDVYPNESSELCIPIKANTQLNEDIKKILSLDEIGYNKPEYTRVRLMDCAHLGTKEIIDTLANLCTVHSFRRSFINLAVNRGVNINHLASMLGCQVRNIEKYYKTNEAELKKSAMLLED